MQNQEKDYIFWMKNDIKVLLGDVVEIEFSPYDLARGRITRRR